VSGFEGSCVKSATPIPRSLKALLVAIDSSLVFQAGVIAGAGSFTGAGFFRKKTLSAILARSASDSAITVLDLFR